MMNKLTIFVQNKSKKEDNYMNTLYKMKDLWTFFGQSFDGAEKYLKAIRKARTVTDYRLAANAIFRTCRVILPAPSDPW